MSDAVTGDIPIEDRRKAPKKERDFFGWLQWQLKRTAMLGAFYVTLGSAVGWLGGRIVSPKEEADKLRAEMASGFTRQDSMRTALAASMQARDSAQTLWIGEMRDQMRVSAESDRFTNYALCIVFRRLDPTLAPAECGPVVRSYRPR